MRLSGKRLLLKAIILTALPAIIAGCAVKQQAEPLSETRLLLDTYCTITIYDTQDRTILTGALDLCAEYEALLSKYIEGSDVWRINHAGGEAVAVMPQTVEIIRESLKYGELSGGMFDITVGRLSTLWDFTGQSGVPAVPEIALARETVDYRQVNIIGNTVQLADPNAWLDLGGVAKGYIADKAAAFIKESGAGSAVIDLGGNIVTVGQKPDGNPWRVGVAKPFSERNDLIGVVNTGEASIVSSGVYERQFAENGVLYHHILDPFTGMPVKSDTVGATVLSVSSMEGDILSTIALLLGSDKAADVFSNASGFIGAALVLEDGELLLYGDIDLEE